MKFKEFLVEGVKILHIDPEDDWDHGEQAYQVAKLAGIRPDITKNPSIVAVNDNDEVVGAAFTSWHHDDEMTQHHGEPVVQYSFDVVVHPQWRMFRTIGIDLIKAAEQARSEIEDATESKAYTRLWVVNLKLAQYMQNKMGYDLEGSHEGGSSHLTKY